MPAKPTLGGISNKISLPEKCQETKNFELTMFCARKYFVINGKPINPMIIKDLIPWLSDSGEQIVAINLLSSQNTNRYFYDNIDIVSKRKHFIASTTDKEGESFSYELKGITNNNIIILETVSWSMKGTGRFSDLLFIRIHKDFGFSETLGNKLTLNRKILLIEKLASYPLGDRVKSKIDVNNNIVTLVTKSFNPAGDNKSTIKKISILVE